MPENTIRIDIDEISNENISVKEQLATMRNGIGNNEQQTDKTIGLQELDENHSIAINKERNTNHKPSWNGRISPVQHLIPKNLNFAHFQCGR